MDNDSLITELEDVKLNDDHNSKQEEMETKEDYTEKLHLEEKKEIQDAIYGKKSAKSSRKKTEVNISTEQALEAMSIDNPATTIRRFTKAQKHLRYTQSSAILTWQNISCESDKGIKLFPTSGYIKPGQMLCILGGGDYSGIPHLFQVLRDPSTIYNAGNHSKQFTSHGDLLLNGLPPGKFYSRTVSFIPKTDNHLSTLKVDETLLFSARMRSPAHITENHLHKSVEQVLEWLGLSEHRHTWVGDANLKGISGGQKRRLSIGVEVVSGYSILVAELPTNGLDAKTAFEVVSCGKRVVKAGNKSMIMSLAQPSPELFNLFDNCCIMAMGECIYFGPVKDVKIYLQIVCKLIQPENKSLPAWIEELTTKPSKFMSNALKQDIINNENKKNKAVRKGNQNSNESDVEYANQETNIKMQRKHISNRRIVHCLAKKFRNSIYFQKLSSEVLWRHLDLIFGAGNEEEDDDDEIDIMSMIKEESDKNLISEELAKRKSLSMKSTSSEIMSDMSIHRDSMLFDVGFETIKVNDDNNIYKQQQECNTDYRKTYDLRGLEHGFVWALPVLPSPNSQIKNIVVRQLVSTFRNTALIYSRLFQAVSIAFCLGILFWRLPLNNESIRSRIGLIFFIVGFMGFGAVPFIPALSTQLPVFYYQKSAEYFKVYAFYLAQIISELPWTFIESLLFALICYFMTGLYLDAYAFFTFFFITFAVRLTSWSFCMAITTLVGNPSIAQMICTVFLPIWYAFNGYLVPASKSKIFIVEWINKTSFFTFPFQFLVNAQLLSIKESTHDKQTVKDVEMWLDVFGIEGGKDTGDFFKVLFITLGWFALFNLIAYYCLCKIDHSAKETTSAPSLTQKILQKCYEIISGVLDVLCCGLGYQRRLRSNERYVQKQINLHKTKKKLEIETMLNQDEGEDDANTHLIVIQQPQNNEKHAYLEFTNLQYSVPIKNKNSGVTEDKALLTDIYGYVQPGEMIALMGSSGAGKSTLLDVLANKKSVGTITGDILLNGSIPDQYYSRSFGYVEQFDSHMLCLTVEEAIQFSADLRIQGSTKEEKTQVVERVIKQLELTGIRNETIENISQEAKKKVTIAVELVFEPGLLFLDEPTTGLDGGAAYSVMKTVRKLCDSKKQKCAVICTIHQPSAEVFRLFDKILILQAGGKTVYFGSIHELEQYYTENGFEEKRPADKNPADYAIEEVENFMQRSTETANDVWLRSKAYEIFMENCKKGIAPKDIKPIEFTSFYASTFVTQFTCLLSRSWKFFIRDSAGTKVRMATSAFMGLSLGMLYYDMNDWAGDYKQNMIVSILYVTVVYAAESAAQEIPLLVSERAMFYREIDSKFYSTIPYYLARILAQFPLIFLQSILYVILLYPMIYSGGSSELSKGEKGLEFFLGVLMMLIIATTFSQMLALCTPNEGVGNVLYTTLCTLCRMFGGYLIRLSAMSTFTKIINGLNFFKYALFYFIDSQVADWQKYDQDLKGRENIQKNFLKDQIMPSENTSSRWNYALGLMLFLGAFHLIAMLAMRFKRWDKR